MPVASSTVVDLATARAMRATPAPASPLVGASGVPLWAGRTSAYEPNARYRDGKWWDTVVPRIANCPPVDTGTATLVDMMLSATFDVSAGDERVREYLRRTFGFDRRPRMLDTWEGLLRRMLRAVFQGAAAFEWSTAWDRADTLASADGTVYLTRLYDRSHRAITAYLTDPNELLVGVRMSTLIGTTWGEVDVPCSQLLYLAFRQRGTTDYDGWGLWRAIADEASDHAELGNQLRAGARRYAVGDIDLTLDVDLAQRLGIQVTQEWCAAEAAAMESWAKKREAGQSGYVTRIPWWRLGTFGGAGSGGIGQGYNPASLVQQRDHYRTVIYEQLAAEYLMIGTQGGGSYSAAEVKVSRAASVARNLLDWVLGELDRQVVRPLIEINFPDVSRRDYPHIIADGLRAPVFVEQVAALVQLAQAGLLTKDDATEDAVREAFELPARTVTLTHEQRSFQSPVGGGA